MNKRVLLGITGGIAAYKIPMLVRLLVQKDLDVHVLMTRAATEFVTPLTLATLSGNPVSLDMWSKPCDPSIEHICLADHADVAVIAPATANVIGKLAAGIADNMLTTVFTAVTCPVLLCPAMNVNMFKNPIVQMNLGKLRSVGYHVMQPESGDLACGYVGEGRLPEPERIAEYLDTLLSPKDLAGIKILVTAGPTEEPLDPVRFLTNRSSGKMGVAVARRAALRGADVTLVAGPLKVPVPGGVRHVPIRTAKQMKDQALALFPVTEVVIKAAAVADFRPVHESSVKIKKIDTETCIQLTENDDILWAMGRTKKAGQILVGFAAETNDAILNGRSKLKAKNLDMLVLNDVTKIGAGFDCDTNIVRLLHRSGAEEELGIMSKEKVADIILDRVRDLREREATCAGGPSRDER
ncbi:MAG: bifunctional phosphopantothenoylcysteine decarboxylase/phosphopantothenate--cysteine ligase CoaBC [Thermodesulfobacteriota bacterium]